VLDELEMQVVLNSIGELDERERAVIRSHYGLGQEARTLRQIGARLGLTAERTRQIEAAALAELRDAVDDAIAAAGPDRFSGKVVIDAMNPLDFSGGFRPSSRSPGRTRSESTSSDCCRTPRSSRHSTRLAVRISWIPASVRACRRC